MKLLAHILVTIHELAFFPSLAKRRCAYVLWAGVAFFVSERMVKLEYEEFVIRWKFCKLEVSDHRRRFSTSL